ASALADGKIGSRSWEYAPRQLLFVVIRNEPIEKSHPPAGAPTFVDISLTRVKSRSGNVEVRPGNFVINEAFDELRGSNRAAPTASAGILHVGEFRVDHLVVFRREWHAPDQLSRLISCFCQALGKLIVVRKHAGIFLPERNDDRTRESCQIYNKLRLE